MQQIIAVCWMIFLLYWFISGISVKPTEETRGWLRGNWYPILFVIGFLFIGEFKFLARFGIPIDWLGTLLIPHIRMIDVPATILVVVGVMVAIGARRTLAGNWSSAVALKKEHELITTGLYHYIRHPIYTGILLMLLGTVLFSGTLGACIGFLTILVSLFLKLRDEEALLSEYFPEEYLAYKRQTKTLIPFIW